MIYNMNIGEGLDQTSLQEQIPASLQYGPSLRSSVVTSRETVRHYPLGAQTIDSRQSRELLFRLASSQFLDPRAAALNFTLHSKDKNVRGQELVALALIKSVTLHAGGVEVESTMNVNDLTRFLIHHSVPKNTYETVYQHLGGWKYKPKARDYIATSTAAHDPTGPGTSAETLGAVNNKFNYYTSDAAKLALTGGQRSPWQGRTWSEDSFPIGDDEYLTLHNGQEFSIPLHILFSFFKTKQLLPVFAMGSLDLKFSLAEFKECMLLSSQYDKTAPDGIIRPTRANNTGLLPVVDNGANTDPVYTTNPDNLWYEVKNIYLTCQWVSCDPSYTVLLQSLISTSPTGVVIPFSAYTCVQRNFLPASQSQILISRGLSYLKNAFITMKPTTMVGNPYVMNDNTWYGDVVEKYRFELGAKLYNAQEIDSTTAAYYELQQALDNYGHSNAGSCIDFDNYNCRRSRFTAQANMPVQQQQNPQAEIAQPNLDIKQAYVIGQSFEKMRGGAELTGVNSRISGYNLHLSLTMKSGIDNSGPNQELYASATQLHHNTPIQLLCFLHYDKALILSKDTISISE